MQEEYNKPMKQQIKRKQNITEQSTETETLTLSGSFGKIGDGIKDSTKDFFQSSLNEIPNQIFGIDLRGESKNKKGGDLSEGQEVVLKKQKEKAVLRSRAHSEYSRPIENSASQEMSREQSMVQQQLKEIMNELKIIHSESTTVQNMFKQIATEEIPTQVGRYHVSFYEWFLSTVKSVRANLSEAKEWLSVMSSKKKQRQYGSMAKKFGTSFTLSGERSTATQTG